VEKRSAFHQLRLERYSKLCNWWKALRFSTLRFFDADERRNVGRKSAAHSANGKRRRRPPAQIGRAVGWKSEAHSANGKRRRQPPLKSASAVGWKSEAPSTSCSLNVIASFAIGGRRSAFPPYVFLTLTKKET